MSNQGKVVAVLLLLWLLWGSRGSRAALLEHVESSYQTSEGTFYALAGGEILFEDNSGSLFRVNPDGELVPLRAT